ncbi:unnamed protein product [Cylindrotheca closterium]|uniref:Uncharacterized protein n=1 Tax=Cylindrotheca closterium TaxID=2856 RepID=A0AAD2GB49_9STRA|nr:unnamed protein product [Cylindrotheca closterium]
MRSTVDTLRAVNYYSAEDDASWAIHTPNVTTVIGRHKQKLYHGFIANCHKAVAEQKEENPQLCSENEEYRRGWSRTQELTNELFAEAKKVVEEWTGQELRPVSLYGIRLFHNGSSLAPHMDRNPLISSAIMYGHEGAVTNVTMAPGDMVLVYESHSVIHGRPFSLNGDFYANIFVHFEPLGPSKDEPLETFMTPIYIFHHISFPAVDG